MFCRRYISAGLLSVHHISIKNYSHILLGTTFVNMAASTEVDANAYTAPFMLTKSLHRDVYPAVDPVNNPSVRADGKVVIVTGASGGLGFVSSLFSPVLRTYMCNVLR